MSGFLVINPIPVVRLDLMESGGKGMEKSRYTLV